MLKWLIGLLASVSSVFTNGINKQNSAPPLNTAIIAYQETYHAPAVAGLGNFPWARKISGEQAPILPAPVLPAPLSAPPPPPSPAIIPTPPAAPPLIPPQDPYLAIPEPIIAWLNMNLTLRGTSLEGDRVLPDINFDREYWRIEIFAYWAPEIIPPKPTVEKDYFKLEIYEKGSNKLVHTITSGNDEAFHKLQTFRKPGTYYFKVSAKDPSKWEISFVVSPKIAQ